MAAFFTRPRTRGDRKNSTQRRPRHLQSASLRFEALESRQLMSATMITDMTVLAQQFPRHPGPTVLNLNFDGYTTQNVQAFSGADRDIQDVLYRTSEIFAPFDVEVRRICGNGAVDTSNGNTTIFIGDDSDNGTGTSNIAYAYTPWSGCDWPGTKNGFDHKPNSHLSDVAFVDPVRYNPAGNITAVSEWIAQDVAHEAGHTFGLVHVYSSPVKDIMSYNSSNVAFRNQAFTIVTDNNSGTSTTKDNPGLQPFSTWNPLPWLQIPIPIVTQNSYSYVATTLGTRPAAGDLANVANTTSVDPAYIDGNRPTLILGSSLNTNIDRTGDYDVFRFIAASDATVRIDVQRLAGSCLDPVLLVYNNTGSFLWHYNDDRVLSDVNSQLVFQPIAGATYNIVVGARNGASVGGYNVKVNPTSVIAMLPSLNTSGYWTSIFVYNGLVKPVAETALSGGIRADLLDRVMAFDVQPRAVPLTNDVSPTNAVLRTKLADTILARNVVSPRADGLSALLPTSTSWSQLPKTVFALDDFSLVGVFRTRQTLQART